MATMQNQTTNEQTDVLTLEKARQIFSNDQMAGDADFAVIRQYYHPNVRFRDAIQEIHGREEFIEMTQRFMKRCRELDVRLNDCAQNGNVIFLQWTMDMRFGKAPKASLEGATKLTLDEKGKVIEHRDYFDLWGDTLDSIPGLGQVYRKLIKKMG